MRHVIIGNSAAAIGAIEGIREHDMEGEITVISGEPYRAYSRPLIAHWLGGEVDGAQMYYRDDAFYARYGVEPRLGVPVTRVWPAEHRVKLQDGSSVAYDRLLIATGGKPFVPPTPGADLEGVFTLTTWEDAAAIDAYIKEHEATSAAVIGGGMIGVKTTEALLARGLRVTIVEAAERVLGLALDPTGSQLAADALQAAGVALYCGTTVQEIQGEEGRVAGAVLKDGTALPADLVVVAIGVRPNTDCIPPDSGIRLERGIWTDARMRTSVPDVYAAGDCAQTVDMLTGAQRPIAIWPVAVRQGRAAGANMAGADIEYGGGLAMNAIDVCGLPTISVGLCNPVSSDNCEVLQVLEGNHSARTFKRLVLRDGRLVGAVLVGNIDRAGVYTGLIREGLPVASLGAAMLSGHFGLIELPREYRLGLRQRSAEGWIEP